MDIDALKACFGAALTLEEDERIDLPTEEQVRRLVEWACSQRPEFRRSIPVAATDHDILIVGALRKLVLALDAAHAGTGPSVVDAAHLERQRAWSATTFGPGRRTAGVLDHIRKELLEIEADPTDVVEWVDVIILAFDGAWRAGWEPQEIIDAIIAKQTRNEARGWPDWRTMSEDIAIEHDRSGDAR